MKIGGRSEQVGEMAPTGVQAAVLVGCWPVGLQVGWEDKIQDKVVCAWESTKKDSKGRPFVLFDTLTNSSHEKSTMVKRFAALAGRAPTQAELDDGFDIDPFVGRAVLLNVVPPGEGGKWPRIESVMPLPDGYPAPTKIGDYSERPRFVEKMLARAVKPGSKGSEPIDPVTGEAYPF